MKTHEVLERVRNVVLLLEARGDIDRLERQVMAGEIGSLRAYLRQARREGRPKSDVGPVVFDMMEKLDARGKRQLMNYVFDPDLMWAIVDMGDPRIGDLTHKVRQARRIVLQKVGEAVAGRLRDAELKKHRMNKRVILPGFASYRTAVTIDLPPQEAGSIQLAIEDGGDRKPPFMWLFAFTNAYRRKAVKTRMANLGFPTPRVKRNPYELTMGGGSDYALDVRTNLEGRTLAEFRESALSKLRAVKQLQSFLEFLGKKPPRRNPKGAGISWP